MCWFKNRLRIIPIVFSVLIFSTAGYAATESFSVLIKILTAISVSVVNNLNFGEIEQTNSVQTVTVSPGDSGAATFNISGEPGYAVTVQVVQSSVNLTGAGTAIAVNGFNVGGTSCAGGSGTIDGTGALSSCAVGATATVNANQTAGSYSGSADLQVTYN